VLDAGYVLDLAAADARLARRQRQPPAACFGSMLELLEAGRRGLQAARRLVRACDPAPAGGGRLPGRPLVPLAEVRLLAPVPNPRKVLCLAGNYREHIEEGGRARLERQDVETPRVFMKPPSTTVIGPDEPILIPPVARAIDWEGELAVVIGRRAKGVRADQARRYVAGYTIMNDVSERQLRIRERTASRPRDEWFDWLNGKWLDTFAPQGPWLVTADQIADPQALAISTYVNGERRQHSSTAQMLCPIDAVIEYISAIVALEPGDIISTGTVAGVGATTGTFLRPGDRVEIEITGIGVLRNRVAASRK
jgi:2,4-didehydro-3-deoxy-L-rhamnonate hydrolase